jgi:hypothetical protein
MSTCATVVALRRRPLGAIPGTGSTIDSGEACMEHRDEHDARSGEGRCAGSGESKEAVSEGDASRSGPGNGKGGNEEALQKTLTRLFAEGVLTPVKSAVVPYVDLVPDLQLGFERSATVELEMRPKEDFCRSPEQCTNTLVLDYEGPSRWLTIEANMVDSQLKGAEECQVGIYGRPSRVTPVRTVLRIQYADGAYRDIPLCQLVLDPESRVAHGRGRLELMRDGLAEDGGRFKMLFFLDASADLHLELDYLRVYFV